MPLPETLRTAIFWAAAVACGLAQVALLVPSLRGGARTPPPAVLEGAALPRPFARRAAELGMMLLPAALLALLLLFTFREVAAAGR